jgi:hypothetical protein
MVFDIEWEKTSKTGIMRLKDMCIEDNNPRVLTSLILFAIQIGKVNNAALLVVWADSEETDRYLQSMFTMKRGAQYNRYYRFLDISKGNSDFLKVCPSLIAPPHGIVHF